MCPPRTASGDADTRGDEQNGRFVLDSLAAKVRYQPGATRSAAPDCPRVLEHPNRTAFPLLFTGDHCADMALAVTDIDPRFIASAASVLVSGTHLSQPGTYAACRAAVDAARAAGGRVILDIDFRPVLWGLAPLGDGETRYVQAPSVSASLQAIIAACDLIVGTEEEFCIAANMSDPLAAVIALRQKSTCTLVVKRGALGCTIYPGLRGAAAIEVPGFAIEVSRAWCR